MARKFLQYLFLSVLCAGLSVSGAEARRVRQEPDSTSAKRILAPLDSVAAPPDSARFRMDSLRRADSIATARRDSLDLLKKSSLDMPAFSTAKDSIVTVFTDGQRKIYYYGGATVTYQDLKLTADYIEYDMNTNTVYATGRLNPATGEMEGLPEMEEKGQSYKMDDLRYNFNTRKARITNMITKEAEGLLQGKDIKKMPDNSINLTDGVYTVCDLEHPHYYLKLSMAKVITEPSQKTVFGPAWPVIADVPVPLVLPFGFVPKKPQRATGLLMPTFGEEQARGFFVKDAGVYFVIGDYFDLSLTGSYFTLGSWSVDVNSRYKVNYKFNGMLGFTYSNDQAGEKGSSDFYQSQNFGLKWSHQQDSKAHPGTTFSASVNFSSPSNSRFNSRSVQEAQQNQVSSSISYSHNWNGKVNLSVNALHNQNSRDSSYSFTLPNITLSVTRFYPFKRKTRVGKERFYEKISFGYNTSFQNRVSFKMRDIQDFVYDEYGNHVVETSEAGRDYRVKEAGDSLVTKLMDRMANGMSHTFQIGLPNFTLLKYINVTPSVNYGMNWMFSKGSQTLVDEVDDNGNPVMVTDKDGAQVVAKRVETDPGRAFNGFGATHTYSGSVSLSTRIYGMFNFGKHRKVQAIRHVITPNIGINLSPEKATAFNGYRTLDAYYDKSGRFHAESQYNIYGLPGNHNTVSAPGRGKSATMTLTIGNNLEAKVRDLRDTTGTGTKKVKILDQLNINTGYNFLADSMKMNNVGVSASTNLLNKLNISGNLNFDPYTVNERGQRINRFEIASSGWPLRLTNASLSASISFSGKGATDGNDGNKGSGGDANTYQRIYYHPVTGEYIPGGYVYYMNSNAPWSVNMSYSFNYAKTYTYQQATKELVTNRKFTQTLNLSGNLKLTPRMSIQATSGFDLMAMRFTTTQFSATYDLHCFNIAVSWVPMGMWKSYSFRIAANASALADLLRYKKSDSYMDNMLR